MPPKPPTDSGVPNYVVIKEPSGAGTSQLLQMDVPPDAPQLSTQPPASAPPMDPIELAALVAAATRAPETRWSASNPYVVYPFVSVAIFVVLLFVFRKA
jgi:hypothetical protein